MYIGQQKSASIGNKGTNSSHSESIYDFHVYCASLRNNITSGSNRNWRERCCCDYGGKRYLCDPHEQLPSYCLELRNRCSIWTRLARLFLLSRKWATLSKNHSIVWGRLSLEYVAAIDEVAVHLGPVVPWYLPLDPLLLHSTQFTMPL